MPRAPFDTTCDVWTGPNDPSPGVLLGTGACRFVPVDAIFQSGASSPNVKGWVTMDFLIPSGMFVAPFLTVDAGAANQIAIPSGTSPIYWIVWVERIDWQGQPIYYRASVVDLPLPATTPDGSTCLLAIPTSTGMSETVLALPPGASKWWKIPLAAGMYILTVTSTSFASTVTVGEGVCGSLTALVVGFGSGMSPFATINPGTPDYYVTVFNGDTVPIDVTWDIA